MREAQALNVAIVGDGLGCKAIMDLILGKRLGQLQMKLIGVAYKNPESVGYRFAKKSGIYLTRDYQDFYNLKDLNMIIELTGHKEVADEISRTKPDHVRVMDHVAARVFWDLFQIEERKIADLKRAHDDLRNSEQEKKAILDSILEVVLYQDLEHRMLWGNKMASGSVYLTPEKFVGRYCYEVWQQRSKPCQGCPVVKTYETGQTQEAEITTPDGRIWFVRGYPVRVANGDLAGVVEVKLEITDRKRAEEAMWQSEARYRSLLENIDLGITLIDSDHNIIMTNAAHGKLFKKPASEFVGKKCFREFAKRKAVCSHCPGVQAMASGRPAEVEAESVRDDGTCFNVNIRAFPTFGRDGTATGFIEIVDDITEKKKIESQLRQAHKMEAIGTMSGGIAHDFNNILSIIVGNTELAIDEVPEWHTAQHNLKEVRKACLRAKDVVKQILAFSRETKEERKPVALGPIIKESLRFLRSSTPTTIHIDQYISAESDIALADATQISQVLLNLCTNAAYAMEEKGGTLEVSLKDIELDEDAVSQHPDLTPGSYLRLSVSDTGRGIEPKLIDRIFDPYFTTKEVDEGTGLGLSVADGIVKNHGGTITVETEPGKGSTFHVYLPIIEPAEEIAEPEAEKPIPTGHERILFIDDDFALMEMGKERLERLGYEVVTRTRSIDALELFRVKHDKFDLVITDMTMPNMTGDKLAEELMKIRPDIPVILCTGFSERISKDRAKALGMRAFLMKPVAKREIAETIRKVLDEN